jgi:hypothetical protein
MRPNSDAAALGATFRRRLNISTAVCSKPSISGLVGAMKPSRLATVGSSNAEIKNT